MRPLYRIFALLVLAALSLRSVSAEDTATPSRVSVQFTVVGWNGETLNLAYEQAGKPVVMEVPPFARSKVFTYVGPAKMDLYASYGETPPAKVGSVLFPSGSSRFTVLIGGSGGHYLTRVIMDDYAVFPLGTARVLNLTSSRMLLRYNQAKTVIIASGEDEILRPRADFQFVAETAFEQGGKWRRSNDDFIHVPADGRTSVFYFESDSSYFKSIDGGSRAVQLLILQEESEKPSTAP